MEPERAKDWIKVALVAGVSLPFLLLLLVNKPHATQAERIWIPAGSYTRGDDHQHREEGPRHRVSVKGFWLGKTEVTNRDFAEFVKATGYITEAEKDLDARNFPNAQAADLKAGGMVFTRQPGLEATLCGVGETPWWVFTPGANWQHPEGPNSSIAKRMDHPVVQVSYRDALQYCKWVGGRLPTEAEWERAARGGLEGKTFVWGDEERPKGKFMANHWQGEFPGHDTGEDGFTQTSPVGSFAANGFNLYDMAGNVWEFTVDWYDPELYQAAAVAEALPPLKGYDPAGTGYGQRALRGGSWLCDQAYCFRFRPSARQGVDELTATNHTGFRVVWDDPAPEETSK